jgi:putative redox protein
MNETKHGTTFESEQNMKSILTWKENMHFEAQAAGHNVDMDAKAPIGKGSAQTPKELVLAGLGGCTAMDVMALMKKHKQPVQSFEVEVDVATSTGGSPMVFTKADIYFRLGGEIDKNIALEAAHLSQTKYCGVSAMLLKAFPIEYHVFVNGEKVGSGFSKFE